jgi:hypothetical protein
LILSELILFKKTKHLILPLLNIDINISDIEKILGDDNYYDKIKELMKNNIIQDVCCLQLREHFFRSSTLFDYLKENKCIYKGLLFQVIHTLAVLQEEFKGFKHNNLILKNIFVYLKKNEDNYTEYNGFKNDKFYLPNFGFDIKITNFEKSIIPKFYEIGKSQKNDYYDLYTFMNDLLSFKTINDCDKETNSFFNKYLPENIRNKLKDNQEIITPVKLLYDKYFESFKSIPTKKNDTFNNHQYLTSKNIIETFINSDNYSTLGNQHKIKSNINIMINKRTIRKEKFHSNSKINRIEFEIPELIGGYEKTPFTAEKNTPFISNDERTTFNKRKEENPIREPNVLLEQKIYDTSKPAKKDSFPPPYIPLYDPNAGNAGPQLYPYSNILAQPPVQQKMYNITLSNPIGPHSTINKIYEDIIPGEPRVYSSLTIYERTQLINFIRTTIIDNHDGEDMDITGGKNSLLSFIKVMDCNPYSTKHNPYHDLAKDFLLYKAAYPVRFNGDKNSIDIAKKSIGMNVRMYKMSIGAMKCRSIDKDINECHFDLWREIKYYDWVKDTIIKKKISPNFISPFLYKIDTKSRINWDKLQEIKNKVQIKGITDDLIRNQQKINELHTINKTLGQLSLTLPKYDDKLSNSKYRINMTKITDEYVDKLIILKSTKFGEEHDKIKKEIDEDYNKKVEQLKILYKDLFETNDKDDLSLDSGKVLILLTEAPNSNILQWSGPIYEKFGTIRKMISTGYHTAQVWKSILFQLVYACAVLQKANIYIENFSLENNIFIKDIFTDYNSIGSWIYKVDGINYYIPNYGYILMIDSKFSDVEINKAVNSDTTKSINDNLNSINLNDTTISDKDLQTVDQELEKL